MNVVIQGAGRGIGLAMAHKAIESDANHLFLTARHPAATQGYVDLPRINERELLRLLRRHDAPRAEPLPPGIQRNLERGKPLPPGIAKRFDGPIAHELPRYPGYEWERVGADVVLIEAATRVVVDVLVDALR